VGGGAWGGRRKGGWVKERAKRGGPQCDGKGTFPGGQCFGSKMMNRKELKSPSRSLKNSITTGRTTREEKWNGRRPAGIGNLLKLKGFLKKEGKKKRI